MRPTIRTEAPDVDGRLDELGLKREILVAAVMQGMMARSECTLNDPPLFPGYSAFSRTVRSLREHLVPQPYGWSRCDEGGYSTVVSPDGKMAIAVATGDENTGDPTITPLTKSPKGPRTQSVIEINQFRQRYLFEEYEAIETYDDPVNERLTWILLLNYDEALKEVSCELSLPISYAGKVDDWSERIILGTLPLDPSPLIPITVLPNLPDIDVPLRRRA